MPPRARCAARSSLRERTLSADREAKKATCLACEADAARRVRSSTAGSPVHPPSAKADELVARTTRQAQLKWGDQAAAVAARIAPEEQSVHAWAKGGAGESRLAAFVEREVGDGVIALARPDHPGGARRRTSTMCSSRPVACGSWMPRRMPARSRSATLVLSGAPDRRVYVGGRDRTKLVGGMALQVKAVRAALELDPAFEQIACAQHSAWSRSDGTSRGPSSQRRLILYPGALRPD